MYIICACGGISTDRVALIEVYFDIFKSQFKLSGGSYYLKTSRLAKRVRHFYLNINDNNKRLKKINESYWYC